MINQLFNSGGKGIANELIVRGVMTHVLCGTAPWPSSDYIEEALMPWVRGVRTKRG
jgi:hypothetical protein